ncbi:MAG: substrate-binding periplasmic protein [Massilia sp.]
MFVKLACTLLMAVATMSARAEDITLTNGEWKPFLSEHLPYSGVLSRIVSEAFALEGVSVHYVFRPWPRALAEARNGNAQGSLVWSVGRPDSARIRDFYFSDVVYDSKSVFFHRKDFAFHLNQLADLANYRIGAVAGYEYSFEDLPGVHLDRAATDELCMRKLLAGRFDVFPSSLHVGMYILRTQFSASEAAQITVSPVTYNTSRYHLILPRALAGSPRLMQLFNKGLRRLKESGRYAQYLADLDAGKY